MASAEVADLIVAARTGDVGRVRSILKSGITSVDIRDEKSGCFEALLHLACAGGHSPTIVVLADEFGADIGAEAKWNLQPLHYASKGGHSSCVKDLLERNANANAKDINSHSALHFVAETGDSTSCALLIAHGAKIHTFEDLTHKTPLHIAVENGHTDVMRQLIEADEDFQVEIIYSLLMKTMKRMSTTEREVVERVRWLLDDLSRKQNEERQRNQAIETSAQARFAMMAPTAKKSAAVQGSAPLTVVTKVTCDLVMNKPSSEGREYLEEFAPDSDVRQNRCDAIVIALQQAAGVNGDAPEFAAVGDVKMNYGSIELKVSIIGDGCQAAADKLLDIEAVGRLKPEGLSVLSLATFAVRGAPPQAPSQPPPPGMQVQAPCSEDVSWDKPPNRTLTVNPFVAESTSSVFRTITEALHASKDGDKILVQASQYRENLLVDKAVQLVGEAHETTGGEVHRPEVVFEGNTLRFKGVKCRLANMIFTQTGGQESHAIDISSGTCTMDGCYVTSLTSSGVGVHGSGTMALMTGNVFRGCHQQGLVVYDGATLHSTKDTLEDNKYCGCEVKANSEIKMTSATIARNTSVGVVFAEDSGGILEACKISGSQLYGVEVKERAKPHLVGVNIHKIRKSGIMVYGEPRLTGKCEIYKCKKHGIEVVAPGNPHVEGAHIHDMELCGISIMHATGTYTKNNIYSNKSHNVEVLDHSAPTFGPANQVHGGGASGVYIDGESKGDFIDNEALGNMDHGFYITGQSDPVLHKNEMVYNKGAGVLITGNSMPKLTEHKIVGNQKPGVLINDKSNPSLSANVIEHGQSVGVEVTGAGRGVFEKNIIQENVKANVWVTDRGDPSFDMNNQIIKSNGHGFLMGKGAKGSFSNCVIADNADAGISLEACGSSYFTKNDIYKNDVTGVQSIDGATGTLEDNDIHENGEAESFAQVLVCDGGNTLFTQNKIHAGPAIGVKVFQNGQGTFDKNQIYGNKTCGVDVSGMGNPKLTQCEVLKTVAGPGLRVTDKGQGMFVLNQIKDNATSGVMVETGGNPVLNQNDISGNRVAGIAFASKGQGKAEENKILSNGTHNVTIVTGANPTLRHNKIFKAAKSGVLVGKDGWGVMDGNEIYANTMHGVEIEANGNPTLRKNIIYDNHLNGVNFRETASGLLDDNRIWKNRRCGVKATQDASPNLRGNKIEGNGANGVEVEKGATGVLDGNAIFENCLAGVLVTSGAHPTIVSNDIHDGKGEGLLFDDNAGQSLVEKNRITANVSAGICVRKGSDPTVRGNILKKAKMSAILVCEAGLGTFEKNILSVNESVGVEVTSEADPKILGNEIFSNRRHGVKCHGDKTKGHFEGNEIHSNGEHGVVVSSGACTVFKDNRIHDSKLSGAYVTINAEPEFAYNDIYSNNEHGIDVDLGGNPVIGNAAKYLEDGGKNHFRHNKGFALRKDGHETSVENLAEEENNGVVTSTMRLQMEIGMVPPRSSQRDMFADRFRQDVAMAAGTSASRIQVNTLEEGSIIVEYTFLNAPDSTDGSASGEPAMALARKIKAQLVDPGSKLRVGQVTSKLDPSHIPMFNTKDKKDTPAPLATKDDKTVASTPSESKLTIEPSQAKPTSATPQMEKLQSKKIETAQSRLPGQTFPTMSRISAASGGESSGSTYVSPPVDTPMSAERQRMLASKMAADEKRRETNEAAKTKPVVGVEPTEDREREAKRMAKLQAKQISMGVILPQEDLALKRASMISAKEAATPAQKRPPTMPEATGDRERMDRRMSKLKSKQA